MEGTAEISLKRSVSDVSPGVRSSVRPPVARPPAVEDQLRARAAEHRAARAAEAEEPAETTEAETGGAPEEAIKGREDLSTIDVELPDGRVVHFGPPEGIALQLRIAALLGDKLTSYTAHIMRTLMCVRAIEGKVMTPIANGVDAQRVANLIGEDGVDLLGLALQTYWPPMTPADLKVVKKNLR
jgi:hypothetical protein